MDHDLSSCTTLAVLLKTKADQSPQSTAFTIDGKTYSCKWLWDQSLHFAALLKAENVREKDRLLIVVPNSAVFFTAFYGTILSGGIAVPLFPDCGTERIGQIAGLCGCRHLIIPENISEQRKIDVFEWSAKNDIFIHQISEFIPGVPVSDFSFPEADDIAFIQYTSGSTDFPKGVPLTHQNLMTNIKQMTEALKITSEDIFVSWLPVYHDMGLILNTMVPLFTGANLVLLQEGLHKVHSWLKTIEKYRGTVISAPDIAYRLCAKSVRRPADYDLSSLRVALNASEPVHLQTYRLFEETFRLKNVMISGYGLAEATVAVTIHPPSLPPVTDCDGYVASGKPLRDIEIRIEPGTNSVMGTQTGEILVKSPALMKRYFNQSTSPHPIDPSGYLHTGDIGYLDQEGFLFVLARKKNIIKQAGHTLYPDDVEQVVKLVENIRNAAAIGVEDPLTGGESLYVFTEYVWHQPPAGQQCHDIAVNIAAKINDHFGLKPGKIYIVKPKTLPATPNGKLQHAILKTMFLNDFQALSKNILYP
jgi:acyl-CoA synthetase (AMP-forming)/AMP-acid ligase II